MITSRFFFFFFFLPLRVVRDTRTSYEHNNYYNNALARASFAIVVDGAELKSRLRIASTVYLRAVLCARVCYQWRDDEIQQPDVFVYDGINMIFKNMPVYYLL